MRRRHQVPRREHFYWGAAFCLAVRHGRYLRQLQAVDDIFNALRGGK